MLGERPGDGAAGDGPLPVPRELPEDPPDPRHAKNAERLVAALFILSALASVGFIAAYVGLEVGPIDAVLRSNLALGLAMSVAFLALAVGAWPSEPAGEAHPKLQQEQAAEKTGACV